MAAVRGALVSPGGCVVRLSVTVTSTPEGRMVDGLCAHMRRPAMSCAAWVLFKGSGGERGEGAKGAVPQERSAFAAALIEALMPVMMGAAADSRTMVKGRVCGVCRRKTWLPAGLVALQGSASLRLSRVAFAIWHTP